MDDDDSDDPWGEEPAWARSDEDGGQAEQDEEGTDGRFGAQHVLAIIDCNPTMFVPCIPMNETKPDLIVSPFDAALVACEKLLRLRVRHVAVAKAGKRDGVGIVLSGTKPRPTDSEDKKVEENSDSDDTDNEEVKAPVPSSPLSTTHTLIPIAPPGIAAIKALKECLPDYDRDLPRRRSLEQEYANTQDSDDSNVARRMGHSTLCPLRSALHEATKSFVRAKCVRKQAATSKNPADAKTVWIFTNQDDPCGGNDEEKKMMAVVAKDAVENGLDIVLWPLPQSNGQPFSSINFYDSITTTPTEEVFFEDSEFDMDDMMEDVIRQWKKVRRTYSLPLLMPDWRDHPEDPGIMLDVYGVVQIQKKPQAITIHQLTNQMTEKTTQTVTKDTGEVILDRRTKTKSEGEPSRIRTFASFGNERVPISYEELAEIKAKSNASDKASLILLGFKPMDSIKLSEILDRAFLLYPNDDLVEGSTVAFANLNAAMIRKKVCAVGELLTRVTATSRLVTFYPQEEEYEMDDGVKRQITPPGFILLHLPFEDDVRAKESDLRDLSTEESIQAAMDLVKNQQITGIEFGYSFKNAALARFWGYIESVAIGTPLKTPQDDLEVDDQSVNVAAGKQIEKFRSLLPADVKAERKRKLLNSGDEVDWLELYKSSDLSMCTNSLLKDFLRDRGLKLSGTKSELIERVSQHLEESLQQPESKDAVKHEKTNA